MLEGVDLSELGFNRLTGSRIVALLTLAAFAIDFIDYERDILAYGRTTRFLACDTILTL